MRTALSKLIKYNYSSGYRYLKNQTFGRLLTVLFGLTLAVSVSFGLYRFGVSGLNYIQGYILYNNAFTLYLYELYLAVIFYITVFGSLIFLLFSLLRSKNDNWILATPEYESLPWFYFSKIASSTLLTISILAIPLILAIGNVFSLSIWALLMILVTVYIFIISGIFFSLVLVFGTSKLLYKISEKGIFLTIGTTVLINLLILGTMLFAGWRAAIPKNIVEFWQIPVTDVREFDTEIVKSRFEYFPSHYAAQYIFSIQKSDSEEALSSFAVTYFIFTALYFLFLLTKENFLPVWLKLQEGSFEARSKIQNGKIFISKKFPVLFKSSIGALFEKEFYVLIRDLKNLTWIIFVVSLWLVYTGINIILKRALEIYDVGVEDITEIFVVYALQISIGIYFVTAFVLRFVFPSFSTEQKTSWIIGTSPINLIKVLYSKFAFFSFSLVLLGLIISIFNFQIFEPQLLDTVIYILVFTITIIAITMIGLFLGILFPNFESDDPEILGTSLPGIILTLTGVLYGALGSLSVYYYLQNGNTIGVLSYLLFSTVLIVILLKISPKILRKIEFAENMLIA